MKQFVLESRPIEKLGMADIVSKYIHRRKVLY